MTVVYLDLLILLNFTANYLLLLITARITGNVIRRWRFALSAGSGALYAALLFLGAGWLNDPLCRVGMGILMSVIAFGRREKLLRTTLTFFCASAALGGMVWAAEMLGGHGLTLENGVLYSWVDIRLLLLLLVLCYGILTSVCGKVFYHRAREMVTVDISTGGRSVSLTALVDTGNSLTDPVTNQPVLVVEGSLGQSLLPMKVPLERPVEALEMLSVAGERGFRLISYHTVGIKNGLLLAMRADCVFGKKERRKGMLVAFSPTSVSDGGGYQALIGGKEWF